MSDKVIAKIDRSTSAGKESFSPSHSSSAEKPTTKNPVVISPTDVHASLSRHMLVDGFDLVVDLKRSQGSYLYDSRYNKRYLDFFT
ncbi:MAG: hypothetical protein WEB62_10575, partial [Bacteroidota bacterium]